MRDFNFRPVLLFLIAIGLVALVAILIVRSISLTSNQATESIERNALVDYAGTSTVVRLTIEGPIVADQNFRATEITIGSGKNEIKTIQGYQGRVDTARSFESNSAAYANFLRALDLQGYTLGNSNAQWADYRGFCPAGQRYIFEIINGSEVVQKYWSASCGRMGNFEGNTLQVLNLFRAQIPEYRQIVGPTKIY